MRWPTDWCADWGATRARERRLREDRVVRDALGPHIYERFIEAKREEWQKYIGQVSEWELNRYLGQY